MEFEKNGKIYKIKELKREWKIVRKVDGVTLNILLDKKDFDTIDDVKEFIIEEEI